MELTREEWERRFVARMVSTAGFDRFDDGELVSDYAKGVAPSYWEVDEDAKEGPEDCADADMSYWGEE